MSRGKDTIHEGMVAPYTLHMAMRPSASSWRLNMGVTDRDGQLELARGERRDQGFKPKQSDGRLRVAYLSNLAVEEVPRRKRKRKRNE